MFIFNTNVAVLNPKGYIAYHQRDLIGIASGLMLLVVIPVFILTVIFAWKYRKSNKKAQYLPDWDHSVLFECLWWGFPTIIIIFLSFFAWRSSHRLNPFKPIENGKRPLAIQVVALEWKWLFIYPEYGIATVNFLQFPEKTPLNFEITSDAPMNSFWIPQLGGQIYAMPAMRTQLYLIADKTGDYRGTSANISGHGFAGMNFIARATDEKDFLTWIESVQSSYDRTLNFATYKELAKPSEYNPVTTFNLEDSDLFDRIIMQYKPEGKNVRKAY